MAVDSASHLASLNPSLPAGSDQLSEADDNFRHLKTVLTTDFPNIGGAVLASHTELNYVDNVTSPIQTQLDAKAPIASPTFTGTPAAPTATAGTATTQLATTAFAMAAIAGVNAQTPLTLGFDAGTSVALSVGLHTVCTNAAAVTATLPAAPTSGQRCRVTFSNTLFTNVISPGSEKIFGASGSKTVNARNASPEFTYVNSTIGWVH